MVEESLMLKINFYVKLKEKATPTCDKVGTLRINFLRVTSVLSATVMKNFIFQ